MTKAGVIAQIFATMASCIAPAYADELEASAEPSAEDFLSDPEKARANAPGSVLQLRGSGEVKIVKITGGVRTSGDTVKLVAASPGEASGKEIDGQSVISQVGRVAFGILSSGVDKKADGFKPAKNADKMVLRGRKIIVAMPDVQPDPRRPTVDWIYDDDLEGGGTVTKGAALLDLLDDLTASAIEAGTGLFWLNTRAKAPSRPDALLSGATVDAEDFFNKLTSGGELPVEAAAAKAAATQSLGRFNCYADSLLLRRDGTIRADDLAGFILGIMENGNNIDGFQTYYDMSHLSFFASRLQENNAFLTTVLSALFDALEKVDDADESLMPRVAAHKKRRAQQAWPHPAGFESNNGYDAAATLLFALSVMINLEAAPASAAAVRRVGAEFDGSPRAAGPPLVLDSSFHQEDRFGAASAPASPPGGSPRRAHIAACVGPPRWTACGCSAGMGACTRTGIDDGCEPPDSVKYILGPDARILLPVDESDRITMITFFTKLSGGLERGRALGHKLGDAAGYDTDGVDDELLAKLAGRSLNAIFNKCAASVGLPDSRSIFGKRPDGAFYPMAPDWGSAHDFVRELLMMNRQRLAIPGRQPSHVDPDLVSPLSHVDCAKRGAESAKKEGVAWPSVASEKDKPLAVPPGALLGLSAESRVDAEHKIGTAAERGIDVYDETRRLRGLPAGAGVSFESFALSNGSVADKINGPGIAANAIVNHAAASERLRHALEDAIDSTVGKQRLTPTLLTEIRGQVKNMMGGIFDVEWATKYLGGIDPDASSAMILYEQASEGTRWGSLSSPQDIRKGVVAALSLMRRYFEALGMNAGAHGDFGIGQQLDRMRALTAENQIKALKNTFMVVAATFRNRRERGQAAAAPNPLVDIKANIDDALIPLRLSQTLDDKLERERQVMNLKNKEMRSEIAASNRRLSDANAAIESERARARSASAASADVRRVESSTPSRRSTSEAGNKRPSSSPITGDEPSRRRSRLDEQSLRSDTGTLDSWKKVASYLHDDFAGRHAFPPLDASAKYPCMSKFLLGSCANGPACKKCTDATKGKGSSDARERAHAVLASLIAHRRLSAAAERELQQGSSERS